MYSDSFSYNTDTMMLGLAFVEMLYRMKMFSKHKFTDGQSATNTETQNSFAAIVRDVVYESLLSDTHICSPAHVCLCHNFNDHQQFKQLQSTRLFAANKRLYDQRQHPKYSKLYKLLTDMTLIHDSNQRPHISTCIQLLKSLPDN
jgi:hypothetical protein